MNLPNKLTLSRIGLSFVIMFFLFVPGLAAKVIALIVFLLACLTDLLDGWIARTRHQISDFGKIVDPIADKILILCIFLAFVELRLVPAWMVVIIMIREMLITGLRIFAVRRHLVLAAEEAGKHKTISQMVTICTILIFLIMKESARSQSFWSVRVEQSFQTAILCLMLVTVILTVYSGTRYAWTNRKLIKSI